MTQEYEDLMEEVKRDEQRRQEQQALLERLRTQYDAACNEYLQTLLQRWELDGHYGYWNSGRPGTIYHYGETHNLQMDDIIYCVEHDIDEDEVLAWEDYLLDAGEFGFTLLSLDAWHSGAPRTPQEVFDRLRNMKQQLYDLIDEEKARQEAERTTTAHSGFSDGTATDSPDTEDQGATVVTTEY